MRRLLPLAALPLLLGAGVKVSSGPPLDVRAVAVYPYAYGWEEPAYRSLLKASDAVAVVAAGRRLPVLLPTEIKVSRFQDDNVLAGSDASKVAVARGLPPRAFLVVRAWADRIGARTVRESVVGGTVRSSLVDETTIVARVQVVDAATGEVVADAEGRLEPGDGGTAPGADPEPGLTELHRRLLAEAWDAVVPRLAQAMPSGDGRGLDAAAFEGFALPGRSSLAELAKRDPFAAQAARREIAGYLAGRRGR
jgi:hypothetical protein